MVTRITLTLVELENAVDSDVPRIHRLDRWISRENVSMAALADIIRQAVIDESLVGVMFSSATVVWGLAKHSGRGATMDPSTVKVKELLSKPAMLLSKTVEV